MTGEQNCPTCGSRVRVYAADEGTCSYEPIGPDERVRELQEALTETLDTARRLLNMVDPDTFSDIRGPGGEHEGVYRAAQVANRLREIERAVVGDTKGHTE